MSKATTSGQAARWEWYARLAWSVLRGTSSPWAAWRWEPPLRYCSWRIVATGYLPYRQLYHGRSGRRRMARERPGGNLSLSRVRCLRGRHRDEMADADDRGSHPERTPNFSFAPKKPSGYR